MCGLEIKVQGSQILSIKGDKNDAFSQGHICPKATALQDIYEDPDRLRHPMRRTDTGWKQISWEEAFAAVEAGLKQVQSRHGHNAVAVYLGNPIVHNWGSMLFVPPFLRSLRTKNRFSATSADQLPNHFAARLMFGHHFLISVPDVNHTDFLLMLGANPLASNGSLLSARGMIRRLKAIQQRGGQVVTIDPRRTETAVSTPFTPLYPASPAYEQNTKKAAFQRPFSAHHPTPKTPLIHHANKPPLGGLLASLTNQDHG